MPTNKFTRGIRRGAWLVAVLVSVASVVVAPVSAMSAAQHSLYDHNELYYDIDGDQTCGFASKSNDATLSGNNVRDAFLYFTDNGMSAMHAAAIVGNLIIESTNPTTHDIDPQATNTQVGIHYGIAQWGGSRLTAMRTFVTAEGKSPDSLLGQLDFIMHELKTDYSSVLTALNKSTTISAGVIEWNLHYEVSGVDPQNRIDAANGVYNKYKSLAGTNSGPTSGSSSCPTDTATASPDCTTATGTTKLLCDAKKYDPASYVWGGGHDGGAAYHQKCPTINTTAACGLDTSGLVSVAAYDTFRNGADWTTATLLTDTANWKKITLAEAKPGDLVLPEPNHVEIIDHIAGTVIYTFGAHGTSFAQPEQVGAAASYVTTNANNVYLHYVGTGS